MKNYRSSLLLILSFATSMFACSQNGAGTTRQRMPIYVLPVYNWEDLTINAGEYSHELMAMDSASAGATIETFNRRIDSIPIEAIYVLSIRLYDVNRKDEAVYWFHKAKSRARVFINMLDSSKVGSIGSRAFELKEIFIGFNQTAGTYVNGYAGGDLDKYIATLEKVRDEVDGINSFRSLYPDVSFLSDAELVNARNKKKAGLQETIDYVKAHKEEMQKHRKKAGVDGEY